MSDPWFDIRDDLSNPDDWEPKELIELPEAEVRALLNDADALLALPRVIRLSIKLGPRAFDKIMRAYNALPKHLRGDK